METLLYILAIIVLIVTNIFFVIRGTQLVKQLEEIQTKYNNFSEDTLTTMEAMLEEMRAIDLRGSFESDDEVGATFTELKTIVENLNEIL